MRGIAAVAGVAAIIVLALGSVSCAGRSERSHARPAEPVVPAPPVLTDPISAVRSYTQWISYAYRVANSDVATHAFSLYEEVRVNSYIQYNLLEKRALEQTLVAGDYRVVSAGETTATVAGVERWRYRYITPDGRRYLSPEYTATYDITYTVIYEPPKGWVVDRALAKPRGAVK